MKLFQRRKPNPFKPENFHPDINNYEITTGAGNCVPLDNPLAYSYTLRVNTHYEDFTKAIFDAMEEAGGKVTGEWLRAYWESEDAR